MIGTLNPLHKEAVIVGAGISGLVIGYRLKQLGYKIEIHEKSSRSGGLIQTIHTPLGLVETAAHSLMVNAEVKNFMDNLNVPLFEVNPHSRARFIVRSGKMCRLPLSPLEALSAAKGFFSSKAPLNASASLEEWCLHYLGKPVHDYLLAPFVTGIFACAPSELNAKLAFPRLVPAQETSLFRHFKQLGKNSSQGRSKMMAPINGMQSLIDALTQELKSEIHFQSEITKIPDSPNVVWTLPIPEANLQYSPLIKVTVFYKNSSFCSKPPKGVGVLIPRSENIRALGVMFNSSSFENRVAHPELTSLTYMFGGTQDPSALSLTDDELQFQLEQTSSQLFSAKESPEKIVITRWPKAIPIYSNSLVQAHEFLNKNICNKPGRIIFSNYSGQVSIRGLIETASHL